MITRSKLVEQLRDYQIRSQHKCPGLIFFSPKPHITSWDVPHKHTNATLVEKLQDKRSRVEGGYVAKRNGELIESDVERWLTEVGEIVEKLGKFLEDDAIEEKRSCFKN
ncbi:unnamed protein product [Camellia sinensis]